MTPEAMGHAFEPFYTTKQRGKGSGLGLSTALGIVQQSGGFMLVESEVKGGSVFSVYLPRVEGASLPVESGETRRLPEGGHETILVAEDEAAVRNFVERVLTGAGYQVTVACSGDEAIERAASLPYMDLLFTDVVMPGMSGVQLAAHLTKTRADLPVIFASGYSDEGVPRVPVLGGRASYLPKPFTAEILLRRVREVLDQR